MQAHPSSTPVDIEATDPHRASSSKISKGGGRVARLCLLAALMVAVAGCGGGSGTDSAASNPIPSPSPPPPPPPPAPSYVDPNPQQVAAPSNYTDQLATDMLALVNQIRSSVGLGPLVQNLLLDQAAANHLMYQYQNGELGHTEIVGHQLFTGVTPGDRLAAVGYKPTYYYEVTNSPSVTAYDKVVKDYMGGPYHRGAFLLFEATDFGTSIRSLLGKVSLDNTLVAWGNGKIQGAPGIDAVVWPRPSMADVPISACCESPSPLVAEGKGIWGYPASVHVRQFQTLTVQSFKIKDGSGTEIPVKVIWSATDGEMANTRYQAYAVPLSPLMPQVTYSVSFDGLLDGTPLSKSWSFTTGSN